jgi:hypothetical protein
LILTLNLDKDDMKKYLLGTLDGDRKSQLEERILSEPDVYEELLLTEEELIDQYVAGSLTGLEQQQFETNFLTTSERQKHLQFARHLKRYMNSHAVLVALEEPSYVAHHYEVPAAKAGSFFSGARLTRRPMIGVSVAVVAFAVILFLCWHVRKGAEHVGNTSASVATVVPLTPGSTRSVGATVTRVQIPPKGSDVKLELETNTNYQHYKSELLRENNSLKTIGELRVEAKGEQHVVPLVIPGELLGPGDYQVRLSGVLDSGADEFIDNYSFRVIE